MEVVHDSPEILVFHEVVFPQELEEIKRLGKPFVSIKTILIIRVSEQEPGVGRLRNP